MVEQSTGAVQLERDLRDEHHVGVVAGQRGVAGDKSRLPAHQLHQADAVRSGLGLNSDRVDRLGGTREGGLEPEALVQVGMSLSIVLGTPTTAIRAPRSSTTLAICIAPRMVPSPPDTKRMLIPSRSRQPTTRRHPVVVGQVAD